MTMSACRDEPGPSANLTMVLHGSAILAILLDTPEAAAMLDALVESSRRLLSAATWLELAILVEERGGRIAALRFDEFIRAAAIEIVPVSPEQAAIARTAWRHFGASRHSARLNHGDCLAYALAKTRGEKLLFTGIGFTRTDIEAAHPAEPHAA